MLQLWQCCVAVVPCSRVQTAHTCLSLWFRANAAAACTTLVPSSLPTTELQPRADGTMEVSFMPVSIGAPVHSITPYAKPPPTAGATCGTTARVAASRSVFSFVVAFPQVWPLPTGLISLWFPPLGCGFFPQGSCLCGGNLQQYSVVLSMWGVVAFQGSRPTCTGSLLLLVCQLGQPDRLLITHWALSPVDASACFLYRQRPQACTMDSSSSSR